jgi:flagellar L-ring protein precursor FlgH
MKTPIYVTALLICAGSALAQDMRGNIGRSLFADQKAAQTGDAVTVLVVETSSASNDASTSAERASNLSLSAAGNAGSHSMPDVSVGIGSGNSFKGEGATSSRGSVRARISARVDSVLANGNLVITGNRTIIINGEEQVITISGIVRPSDVQADNSVYSYNISDARIVFEGGGIVARAQGPGWITKLLHWLF